MKDYTNYKEIFNKSASEINDGTLYIHFPFCRSKCDYCAFHSRPDPSLVQIEEQLSLTESLASEFFFRFPSFIPRSVYFGGGTPSMVDPLRLQRFSQKIFENIPGGKDLLIEKGVEWTIEANCRDITKENLKIWADIGINRISLGIQSLRDEVLAGVRRNVTSKEQIQALDLLSEYWPEYLSGYRSSFQNPSPNRWSIDMIAGLPGYRNRDFIEDLNELLFIKKFNFGHISIYDLIVEEGTPLFRRYREPKENDSDNDLSDLWDMIKPVLKEAGFSRYEISNFSKPGEESFHNSQYWEMRPYLGLGEGAVSMLPGTLTKNKTGESIPADIFRFTQKGEGMFEWEDISTEVFMKEFLMMGLRQTGGVDLNRFEAIFQIQVEKIINNTLKRYSNLFSIEQQKNSLEKKGRRLKLSDRGLDILNTVVVSIFEEIERD